MPRDAGAGTGARPRSFRGLDRADEDRLVARALDEARTGGAVLAEVLLKSSWSARRETGDGAAVRAYAREEHGMAVRLWLKDGRPGFAHGNGPSAATELIVRSALAAARAARPGPIPELPRPANQSIEGRGSSALSAPSSMDRTDASSKQPEGSALTAERSIDHRVLVGRAEEAISAIEAAMGRVDRRGLVRFPWAEEAITRTHIVNSAGLDAHRNDAIAAAGAIAASPHEAREIAPIAASWFGAANEDLHGLPPEWLVREALRSARVACGDATLHLDATVAILDVAAAAAWVRWHAPLFGRGVDRGVGAHRATIGSGRSTGGLTIHDDPPPLTHDGVGRLATRRLLVDAGQVVRHDETHVASVPARRDSYRDLPTLGPLELRVASGRRSLGAILDTIGEGVLVVSLAPLTAPGSGILAARIRGAFLRRGAPPRPLAPALLTLPGPSSFDRACEAGTEARRDASDLPVTTPAILLDRARIVTL